MHRFLCLFAALAVSVPAATLIPAANFSAPTTMTFSGSTSATSPAAYTEAGASIRESNIGHTIYVYSGILDADIFSSASLDVRFPSLMDRFGFLANSSAFTSHNFTISSVTFYSDTAMTSVTETYNTAFNVTSSDTFFGLQQGAGSFAAVRIAMTAATGGGTFSPTIDDFRFEAGAVPEPASLALLGLGAGSLVIAWRRRAASKR
ncbi:MAG: PEP-CTERM sorting domain-containing protein [Bryobacteraceae bacterium]